MVQRNIKGILFSFLKTAKKDAEKLAIEKPVNADSALPNLTEILTPVQGLLADNNTFQISFSNFVKFIYQCIKPKEASSIVSNFTKDDDIPNLVNLLRRSHPLIKESIIKGRISRIITALKKLPTARDTKN